MDEGMIKMHVNNIHIPYWQKFLITIRTAELMDKKINGAKLYKSFKISSSTVYEILSCIEREGFVKSEKPGRNRYWETTLKGRKIADGLMVLNPYIYDDVDNFLRLKLNKGALKKK